MKRLALVSPVTPMRGGIAEYATGLHRALQGRVDLRTFSYQRMYPAFLFPGANERDPARAGEQEPGVNYLLDGPNPLSWPSAARAIGDHRPDALILPWWTAYFAPLYRYLGRATGLPLLYICVNVAEHETARWRKALGKSVLERGCGYMIHSESDRALFEQLGIRGPVAVHAIPTCGEILEPQGSLPKRAPLEVLFFGFVRPYKGLGDLIEAVARSGRSDIALTIAGEHWTHDAELLAEAERLSGPVEIIPRFVSDQTRAELFGRADVVVLPYRAAGSSGVIPLAMAYDTPVIVSDVGGLAEPVVEGVNGWIVPPADPGTLAALLSRLDRSATTALAPKIRAHRAATSWASYVDRLLTLLDATG